MGRMLLACLASVALLAFGTASNAQQDCDAILKDGVFNKNQVRANSYSQMLLAWELSKLDEGQARIKLKGGLALEGVISGNFDGEQFNNWKKQTQEKLSTAQIEQHNLSLLQLTASPVIVQAWVDCQERKEGLAAWLEPVDKSSQIFTFKIRFRSSSDAVPFAVVETFNISGGKAVFANELKQVERGAQIGGGGRIVQIERTSPNVPIVVTLNSPQSKPVLRSLPPVVPVPVMPRKPPAPPVASVPQVGKWYRIRVANNPTYHLNVYFGRFGQPREPLCIAPASPAHLWKFVPVGGGAFEIVPKDGPSVVVAHFGGGIVQGNPNLPDFQWTLEPAGSGKYRLRNRIGGGFIAQGAYSEHNGPHFALRYTMSAGEALVWELSEQGDVY